MVEKDAKVEAKDAKADLKQKGKVWREKVKKEGPPVISRWDTPGPWIAVGVFAVCVWVGFVALMSHLGYVHQLARYLKSPKSPKSISDLPLEPNRTYFQMTQAITVSVQPNFILGGDTLVVYQKSYGFMVGVFDLNTVRCHFAITCCLADLPVTGRL